MKKLLTMGFSAFSVVCLWIFLASCGGEKSSSAENNSAEFDSVTLPVYSGNTAIAVTHEVKNYDEWIKVYTDASDPQSRLSIFASPEDPNLITVFELTKSHEDARNAFASDRIKKAMQDAGVTSEPVFHYYDIKFRVAEKTDKKYRLGVSHEVDSYEKWRKVFDEDEPIRAKANLELRAISVDAGNDHMVNIMFATEDIDKAKGVINSDELRKRMQLAGVRSEPSFTVYTLPGKSQ